MTDLPRFCQSCGKKLDPAWVFCENCGKPVPAAAPIPAAPPAPLAGIPPVPPVPPAPLTPPQPAVPAVPPAAPVPATPPIPAENLPWPGYVEPKTPPPAAPKKSTGKVWVIVVIVVIAACCCLSLILAYVFKDQWLPDDITSIISGTSTPVPAVQVQPAAATPLPVIPTEPTVVPPASPTIPPDAQPVYPAVEYQDNFSKSNSRWNTFDDSDAYSGFHEGGVYAIAVRVPNMEIFAYPDLDASGRLDDATVNMSAFKVEGEGDWGIMCRYGDVNNFYRVAIDSGAFAIYKVIDNEVTYLTSPEWIESNSLDPAGYENGQIPISLTCRGDTILFETDGFKMYEVTDNDLSGGDIRIYAGSYETIGDVEGYYIKVLFDNFELTTP